MTTLKCPANIRLLLHYHCMAEPFENGAPVYTEATKAFLETGLIEPCEAPKVYRTTPLGRAWVDSLCNLPIPEACYVDAFGAITKVNP